MKDILAWRNSQPYLSFQLRECNAQLEIKVQLMEQEVGLVKSKNASERNEEEDALNAMHEEIKRLIAEK